MGSKPVDWLSLLTNQRLGQAIFADLPGFIKLVDKDMLFADGPVRNQFDILRTNSDAKAAYNKHVGEMLSVLADDPERD